MVDARIKELEISNKERAEALKNIRVGLTEEIAKGAQEIDLTMLYNSPKVNAITRENGVDTFLQFINLLGLDYVEDVDILSRFTKRLFEKEVNGHKVKIEGFRFITTEALEEGLLAAIDEINKRVGVSAEVDIVPYVTEDTVFEFVGGPRFKFTIERNGKKVRYVATPQDVLRIDKEAVNDKSTDGGSSESLLFDEINSVAVRETESGVIEKKGKVKPYKDYDKKPKKIEEAEATHLLFKRVYYDKNSKEDREVSYYVETRIESELKDGDTKKTMYHEFSNYKSVTCISGVDAQGNEQLLKIESCGRNGKPEWVKDFLAKDESITTFYFEDGGVKYKAHMKGEKIKLTITFNDGEKLQNFHEEKEKNSSLTPDEYLNLLAKRLDSPEKLAVFFDGMMSYLHDDVEQKDADYKTANIGGKMDYWQTPEETIARVDHGQMLGDCDDFAFLAREILKRQGENAHVIMVPGHVECIWVKKRPDGRYDAYSLGTFGFDKNGNIFGMHANSEKEKGYATIKDAVNSLMEKYDGTRVDALVENGSYRISDSVKFVDIPAKGERASYVVPVESLDDSAKINECRQYGVAMHGITKIKNDAHRKVAAIGFLQIILTKKIATAEHVYDFMCKSGVDDISYFAKVFEAGYVSFPLYLKATEYYRSKGQYDVLIASSVNVLKNIEVNNSDTITVFGNLFKDLLDAKKNGVSINFIDLRSDFFHMYYALPEYPKTDKRDYVALGYVAMNWLCGPRESALSTYKSVISMAEKDNREVWSVAMYGLSEFLKDAGDKDFAKLVLEDLLKTFVEINDWDWPLLSYAEVAGKEAALKWLDAFLIKYPDSVLVDARVKIEVLKN